VSVSEYTKLVSSISNSIGRGEYARAVCMVAKYPKLQSIEEKRALVILNNNSPDDLWSCLNIRSSEFEKNERNDLIRRLVKIFIESNGYVKRTLIDNGHLEKIVTLYFFSNDKSLPIPEELAGSMGREKYNSKSNKIFALLFCKYKNDDVIDSWFSYLEYNKKYIIIINYIHKNIVGFKKKGGGERALILGSDMVLKYVESLPGSTDKDKTTYPAIVKGLDFLDLLIADNYKLESTIEKHEKLCSLMLSSEILKGRASSSIISNLFNIIPGAGGEISSWFGIKDPELPHDKRLLDSSPKLLSPELVAKWMANSRLVNTPFNNIKDNLNPAELSIIGSFLSASTIWEYMQIDSNVLKAIDFSYTNEDSWAGRVVTAKDILDKDGKSLEGALNRLNGYTAEQQVAMHYSANGHLVEVAEASNQKGWDLLIDGEIVQVKNTINPGLVQDALNSYPDIPVITNIEMYEHFKENPMVWPDGGLVYEEVANTTLESLESLDELSFSSLESSEELLSIPLISVAFSLYRNRALLDTPNEGDYIEKVSEDVLFRAGGAMGVASIGMYIGALGGPVGMAAGAIIGSMIGNSAGSTMQEGLNSSDNVFKAKEEAIEALGNYAEWFASVPLGNRIERMAKKLNNEILPSISENQVSSDTKAYFRFVLTGYQEMITRCEELQMWILTRLESNDFSRANAGWAALNASSSFFGVEITKKVKEVGKSIEKYRVERGIPEATGLGAIQCTGKALPA